MKQWNKPEMKDLSVAATATVPAACPKLTNRSVTVSCTMCKEFNYPLYEICKAENDTQGGQFGSSACAPVER